ncbi:MAG: hypothetical protein ACP5HG_00365 [Anaerolineae bacterium]
MSDKLEIGRRNILPIRGFLLHITHYDPRWWEAKPDESPFDLEVGLALVDEMAKAGLNLLVVDCADGIEYATHPELARHYTVPKEVLVALAERARANEIEIVPKLNFAQSGLHRHNHWFRPHHNLFDSDRYWELAFEIIDEVIEIVQPARFFHVGMDEDHWRSYDQYVAAIRRLRAGVKARGLRTLIWNDSACLWPQAAIHRDKSLEAEKRGPRDVIHIVWDYSGADLDALKRVADAGLEVWGAPGREPHLVTDMRDALLEVGGTGILLTRWVPCTQATEEELRNHIRTLGPLCSSD